MTEQYNRTIPQILPSEKVVGWLVCKDGDFAGSDYRIVPGFNWVGRDSSMDIMLYDDSVAEDHHCAIVYDDKNNQTFLVPESEHSVFLDEEPVTEPVLLQDNSEIRIGNLTLIYIAFCRGERSWDTICKA